MSRLTFAFVFALLVQPLVWAGNVTPEEAAKQAEFRKSYGSKDKADKIKAIALLDGCHHPSSLQLLVTVINAESDHELKIEAFKLLSAAKVRNPSHSQLLVSLFQQLKPNDVDTRIEYGRAMGNSEFKYHIIEALADMGNKMRYPDLFTGPRPQNQGAVGVNDPNAAAKKSRDEFTRFVAMFNQVAGADVKATDKNSPVEVRKWWEVNRGKTIAADKELAEKYRAEDEAQRDRDNPLAGKKEKKDD